LNKWIRRLLIFILVILFIINGGFKFLSEGLNYLVSEGAPYKL
jgi:hypothetical protein